MYIDEFYCNIDLVYYMFYFVITLLVGWIWVVLFSRVLLSVLWFSEEVEGFDFLELMVIILEIVWAIVGLCACCTVLFRPLVLWVEYPQGFDLFECIVSLRFVVAWILYGLRGLVNGVVVMVDVLRVLRFCLLCCLICVFGFDVCLVS